MIAKNSRLRVHQQNAEEINHSIPVREEDVKGTFEFLQNQIVYNIFLLLC